MAEDIIRALGFLALGSRFKRLGERLQAQTQTVFSAADAGVPAAQAPVLAALDRLGPVSIGDLTLALGVTQPAVTRMTGKLEAAGLVRSERDAGDRRVNTVTLTEDGRRLVDHSKRTAWPAVEAAVADACRGLSGPLLAQLTALEDALAKAPLPERAERLRTAGGVNARA